MFDNIQNFTFDPTDPSLKNLKSLEDLATQKQSYEYVDEDSGKTEKAEVQVKYNTDIQYLIDGDVFKTNRVQVGAGLGNEPFVYEFTPEEWESLSAGSAVTKTITLTGYVETEQKISSNSN